MADISETSKEAEPDADKNCITCASPATLTCANCNYVKYCSKEHQKEHWKKHKDVCRPYIIKRNEILGRYIVASRDIKQGELILRESPSIVGPQIEAAPLCLNCYRPIDPLKNPTTCQKCKKAPFCSLFCKASGHKEDECNFYQTNDKITTDDLITNCQIVMPLRCLLLKKHHPLLWKTLMEMESHVDKRRNTPIWRNHKMNVEDIVAKYDILTEEDIKDEVVQKICGILDVNTFELRAPGFGPGSVPHPSECVRGLYLQAALMAHDCLGNTHLAVDDHYNLIIHSCTPIAKGSPILFNYTNALQGTHERREHLKEGKYFSCACKRCSDASECGTHMSSLRCVKCHDGLIVPVNPTEERYNYTSVWKCMEDKCSYQYKGSMISLAVQEAQKYAEEIDRRDNRSVEQAIKKLLITLSKEHAIILDLKQCLIGIHSETLRREPNPNRKLLNRKLELCKEILPVLQKVEPGISRMKGITLYEMHVPMVISANKAYDNGEISAEQLLTTLLESQNLLKESISILLYEPNESPEGRLRAKAMNELKFLRNSINSVEQIVEKKKQNINKRRQKKKNK